jgi:hypothetical protein
MISSRDLTADERRYTPMKKFLQMMMQLSHLRSSACVGGCFCLLLPPIAGHSRYAFGE